MGDPNFRILVAQHREPFPSSALLVAIGLLLSAAAACAKQGETPAIGTNTGGTATHALAATPESPTTSSPQAAALAQRTVRGEMLSHYADAGGMRRALVAGKLADYQAAADAVAREGWAPSAGTARERELTEQARAVAGRAKAASTLVDGAQALGSLGDVCATCHLEMGAIPIPIAPEESTEGSNPRMIDHAIASDRLWAGLTLPSDESWASGMRLLLRDPALANPSGEVAAAVQQLTELARRGERAEQDQRGHIFADVLMTCSGCHERLGVVLVDGRVAR